MGVSVRCCCSVTGLTRNEILTKPSPAHPTSGRPTLTKDGIDDLHHGEFVSREHEGCARVNVETASSRKRKQLVEERSQGGKGEGEEEHGAEDVEESARARRRRAALIGRIVPMQRRPLSTPHSFLAPEEDLFAALVVCCHFPVLVCVFLSKRCVGARHDRANDTTDANGTVSSPSDSRISEDRTDSFTLTTQCVW
eukprot:CAMPEP_0175839822 /NCGR_PEP_ID=MMETSP0107_2-20121207/19022_1 /TAXON_ID=195067 ORGANISM="Goniomonas pacifica, Strain CCMP1869" /NCGR_SAMPLE_ID=MMETSP0107_2 /ASSEMBLY_ACC=CAM_ASM_000203 /LENGTH=195 /DNA_ID=CAMNT_0017153591 /DNA_START=115 /DNA_END=699 /DNA_ORIENTATION=-